LIWETSTGVAAGRHEIREDADLAHVARGRELDAVVGWREGRLDRRALVVRGEEANELRLDDRLGVGPGRLDRDPSVRRVPMANVVPAVRIGSSCSSR
jgi:hypothetical protein